MSEAKPSWVYCTPMRYRVIDSPPKWLKTLSIPIDNLIALVRTGQYPKHKFQFMPFQMAGGYLREGYIVAVMPTQNMNFDLQNLHSFWHEDVGLVSNLVTAMWIDFSSNEHLSEYQSKLEKIKAESAQLAIDNSKLKQIVVDIRKLESENTQLQITATKTNSEYESVKKRLNSTLQELNQTHQNNVALQLENDELRRELNQLYAKQEGKQRNGYVYLLRVLTTDNLYKIGRAKNPDNRLATFNVKLPFPVEYEHVIQTDDMYTLETELHTYFAGKRQTGSEFFILQSEDVQYIKALRA